MDVLVLSGIAVVLLIAVGLLAWRALDDPDNDKPKYGGGA